MKLTASFVKRFLDYVFDTTEDDRPIELLIRDYGGHFIYAPRNNTELQDETYAGCQMIDKRSFKEELWEGSELLRVYPDYDENYQHYLYADEESKRSEFEGKKFYICYNEQKVVFVFDDFEEVIKIPFTGKVVLGNRIYDTETKKAMRYDLDCETLIENPTQDPEDDDYDGDEDYSYYANPTLDGRNAIAQERLFYREFKGVRIRNFLPYKFLCRYGGLRVFVQKKIDEELRKSSQQEEKKKEDLEKLHKDLKMKLIDIEVRPRDCGYLNGELVVFSYSGHLDKIDGLFE